MFTRIVRTGLSSTVSTPAIAAQWTMWVAPAASSRTRSASSTSPRWKVKRGCSASSVPESASRCRLSSAITSFASTSRRASVVPMNPAPPVIRIRLPCRGHRASLATATGSSRVASAYPEGGARSRSASHSCSSSRSPPAPPPARRTRRATELRITRLARRPREGDTSVPLHASLRPARRDAAEPQRRAARGSAGSSSPFVPVPARQCACTEQYGGPAEAAGVGRVQGPADLGAVQPAGRLPDRSAGRSTSSSSAASGSPVPARWTSGSPPSSSSPPSPVRRADAPPLPARAPPRSRARGARARGRAARRRDALARDAAPRARHG